VKHLVAICLVFVSGTLTGFAHSHESNLVDLKQYQWQNRLELSKLIDILNERFGTEFKPGDQLFFDSIREDAVADTNLRQAPIANTMENFAYVFRKALEGFFIDRMEQNEEITAKFMNAKDFQATVTKHLLERVYREIREEDAQDFRP
jgi:type I restriction enzyme, R subunit